MRKNLALLALLVGCGAGCGSASKPPPSTTNGVTIGGTISMVEVYDPTSTTGVAYIIPSADGSGPSPENKATINMHINVQTAPPPPPQ